MVELAGQQTVIAAANLLLAADGRFPAGGYAHSGGLEQAIERERVHDEASLHEFLAGSLTGVGRNAACFAAAACDVWRATGPAGPNSQSEGKALLGELAGEESARIPALELREASRAQGRQYLRAASGTWPRAQLPAPGIVPGGVHLSMAQGCVAAAISLDPRAAALIAAYGSLTGSAAAAVKLLGLDPFAVNRCVAELAPLVAEIVDEAGDLAGCEFFDLPCHSAPLLETGAALHARRQPRMFAS